MSDSDTSEELTLEVGDEHCEPLEINNIMIKSEERVVNDSGIPCLSKCIKRRNFCGILFSWFWVSTTKLNPAKFQILVFFSLSLSL